jgi:hypothetical protein
MKGLGGLLFFLTFFTLPLGLSEDSPLLIGIPILIWILAIFLGGDT